MKLKIVSLVTASVVLTGCLTTTSYVDPKFVDIDYSIIQKPESITPVKLAVNFQRNGEDFKRGDKLVTKVVTDVIGKSGVYEIDETSENTLSVSVNNVADVSDALKEGFKTGLTFGANGTTVTDFYEVTISYSGNGAEMSKEYKHALHSTIGNEDAPFSNVTGQKPQEAFDSMLEDVILTFMKDNQAMTVSEMSLIPAVYDFPYGTLKYLP